MLLNEHLTWVYSQKDPRLHFGKSSALSNKILVFISLSVSLIYGPTHVTPSKTPPPLRDQVLQTTSFCSFSNDNNTLQYMPPPTNHHQKATNNAQKSTKLQQRYKQACSIWFEALYVF